MWRRLAFLPVLALLAGALCLFGLRSQSATGRHLVCHADPKHVGGTATWGCTSVGSNAANKCTTVATFSDDDFTVDNVGFQINQIYVTTAGQLAVSLNRSLTSALKRHTLVAGSAVFHFSEAGGESVVTWDNSGLNWSNGSAVQLSLERSPRHVLGHCKSGAWRTPQSKVAVTSAMPESTSVAIAWSAPTTTSTSGYITGYFARVFTPDGALAASKWFPDPDDAVRSGTVEGLTPGTKYIAKVVSRSIFGCYSATTRGQSFTTDAMQGGEGPSSGEEEERDPLTASFETVPEAHDGQSAFTLDVRLSETVGRFSRSPRASSFAVTPGRVTGVVQVGAGLWRVTVQPASSSDVTVTLAGGRDCDDEPSGAVCTPDGRALSNTSSARVAAGPQQQQEVLVTPEPADVRVVPGDGSLTVSWTAVAHPRVAAERVQHALRWSQEAGVWANPSGNNGVAVEAGVNGYTITGLRNGVATGVFVRAFVGRLRSERSEHSSGWVRVKGERTTPQAAAQTVAVEFGKVPSEHDGRTAFALDVQSGSKPAPDAFKVTAGTVTGVESLDPVLWRVRVAPSSWKDVKIALGAASATVPGPARIRVADARAKEGKDASLDFAVTLSRAASGPVSVDYATKDGTAAGGADYTAASGTLTFAPGETAKTVSVALLDDSHDEGKETFTLRLSNPQGAYLRKMHREAKGVIRNDDPLQAMWLARFGRMVASDAVASVTARLETPRGAGSHVTLMGQRMNFGEAEGGGGAALATVLTGFAQTFGAPSAPARDEDDPFARHRLTSGWNDPAAATGARRVTGRELLLGTSFRAVLGQGAGSQWTSWGQGASVSQFSAAVPGLGPHRRGGDRVDGHGLRARPAADGLRDDAQRRRGHGERCGLALRARQHGDDDDALCAACALGAHLGVGHGGHGLGAHDARPRRRRDAALPHGPRDDARGDGGAGRADSPGRAGRVRAGLEGGTRSGCGPSRPGRGIRVRQPRGRAGRVEPGAGGARRLAHVLVRKRRGADAVRRVGRAP